MNNILLDYFFPITAIEPTPQASTDFLKQVLIVVKPKAGLSGGLIGAVTLATSMSAVAALTDNAEAQQLFNAGMSRVYVLPIATLDIDTQLAANQNFFTVLVSSDFINTDITAADFGAFKGVVGVSSTDDTFLEAQAAIPNRAAFHTTTANKAKNMFFAFGKLLSNSSRWRNQQFIAVPFHDDVDELGEANNLFAKKISFVLSDSQYGSRLGLFAVGGKAIVAPYVIKNMQIDMQSAGLAYISANQPNYTPKQATLIENELELVVDQYVTREDIEAGTVDVRADQGNFIASGDITVTEPKALWRIFAEMRQA